MNHSLMQTESPTPHWRDLPGPKDRWWGLPLLRAMRRDYLGYTQGLQAHGDLVRTRLLHEHAVDVFHPEGVRQILIDHADALIRWERGPEVFAEGMGQCVLVTEGATWQRQRRMLMPAFTPKKVAGYCELMVDATRAALDGLQGEQDMAALFNHLTMDVILRTLFSRSAGPETTRCAAATQVLSATVFREMFWPMTLPDWLPLPGKAAKRRALRTLHELIRAGMARPDDAGHSDLLAMLRALRDPDSGAALSEQELFDQIIVSFQAGHETTATALLWWSLLLARHPEVQARARAEVDTVLAGQAPTPSHELPYLHATLKEAMRLYPPAAAVMTRRLTRDIKFQGIRLPARTLVRLTPWVQHHDPRWWPAPERFQPERFLPGAPEVPRGAYWPFGLGPRVCLGQHFAQLEMTVIAASLLQRYELTRLDSEIPKVELGVTLRPQASPPIHLRPR
ncbi:cytochrome P450 [Inhella inkyongensis]|uniref:Cytochrome P450 n=1 Tax=Inhella inkyongensis TaxID=392593 RepID=A0A840S525_9BURK|nr:cytochrome P450 [Inhella inkyongensis]MBB5204803.1 cytochrome P450 [Inhella inkyongensis]